LQISRQAGRLQLALSKDKAYPAPDQTPFTMTDAGPAVAVQTPDPAELHLLLRGLRTLAPGGLPVDFAWPGKIVDMVAAGVYQAAIAVDGGRRLVGGLFWRRHSERLVECYGPYLFRQPPATARLLLDHLLGALAKSPAIGLLSRYPAPDRPVEYFEVLGTMDHHPAAGSAAAVPVYYRHLEEDMGAVAWIHPALRDFLADAYRRLAFARDLVPVDAAGEAVSPHSVLTAEFNRPSGEVVLRPLWWGADAGENLQDHVRLLRREGLRDLFFELDLGQSWQSHFTPALLAAGFSPRVIVPHGGHGDLLLFQQDGGSAP
jgi:hypothetical protein